MNTPVVIIAVFLAVITLSLFGLMSFLQRRGESGAPVGRPRLIAMNLPPELIRSRALFRIWVAMLGAMLLFIILAVVTGIMVFIWIAVVCLVIALVVRLLEFSSQSSQK